MINLKRSSTKPAVIDVNQARAVVFTVKLGKKIAMHCRPSADTPSSLSTRAARDRHTPESAHVVMAAGRGHDTASLPPLMSVTSPLDSPPVWACKVG